MLSTAGLTDDDIAALRKISGVAKVQGERSQTVTVDLNGKKTVTMQEIGTNGIDQPYLQSGRMPEKSGEIAVTRKFIKDSGYKKGDHITVTPQDSASSASSATSPCPILQNRTIKRAKTGPRCPILVNRTIRHRASLPN